MNNKSASKEKNALQHLKLEQFWLEQNRTISNIRPIETYLQLAIAENAKPDDSIDNIRQFYLCVKKGITPPAEILMVVANKFEKYELAKGDMTLDECFNEKKQGKKHPLKQKLKDEEKNIVYHFMWSQIKLAELEGKKLSIWGAAKTAREKFTPHITTETLEKEYISAKLSDVFNNAYDVIAEFDPSMANNMLKK